MLEVRRPLHDSNFSFGNAVTTLALRAYAVPAVDDFHVVNPYSISVGPIMA